MHKTNISNNNNNQNHKFSSSFKFISFKFTISFSFIIICIAYFILAYYKSLSASSLIYNNKQLYSTNSNLNKREDKENNKNMASSSSDETWKNAKSIYEFSANDIDGNKIELSKYK